MKLDASALKKPAAFFKYGEIVLGTLALALFRGAYGTKNPLVAFFDFDELNLILGSLVGMLICTIGFPVAFVLGHSADPIEMVHRALCALFYLATGAMVVDAMTDAPEETGTSLVRASGIVCLFLALVFVADVVFVGWKCRKDGR